jgi:hypothetical protein
MQGLHNCTKIFGILQALTCLRRLLQLLWVATLLLLAVVAAAHGSYLYL